MNENFSQNTLLKGFLISNSVIFALIGLSKYLKVENGTLIFSEFVVLPLLMGIISAWFWRNLNLKSNMLVGYSIINSGIAILLSFLLLNEGMICLIIVSPLIFGFTITGAFAGKVMFRKNNQKLNMSIFSLLLFIFIADSLSTHHYENLVSDEIVIQAPTQEVWKHVVAFERIKQEENYWLFKVGMPSPVEATVDGYYQGAGRKCIFSNGYIFDEKIVAYKPNEDLTFDILSQPRDPEIMGHIDILRGQFLLKDNGDGTTTLTGNSWYKLYVFPIWYYDLWAESITRNVHLRVMEHIRQLSEKK